MVYFFKPTRRMTAEEERRAMTLLEDSRREKVTACNDADRRQSRMLVYFLLRFGLYREYGVTDLPKLTAEAGGKPRLQRPEFHFNFSHDQGACVCALGRSPLGVDVQKITSRREAVLHRAFSAAERQAVQTAENPDAAFTAIWTRKEAYGKQTGRGICYDMKRTDFSQPCRVDGMELETHWVGDYALSVCAEERQNLMILTAEDLKRVLSFLN